MNCSQRRFSRATVAFALALSLSAFANAQTRPFLDNSIARRAWILGAASLGGGSLRLGPLHASASVEAHVWLLDNIGIGGIWGGMATGVPDGASSDGSFVLGTGSYRYLVRQPSPDSELWFVASLGAGQGHANGYDQSNSYPKSRYDVSQVMLLSRIGAVAAWEQFTFGSTLEHRVMPTHGSALMLGVLGGVAF